MRLEKLHKVFLIIASSLAFQACAGGIESTTNTTSVYNVADLKICKKEYYNGTAFVPLTDASEIPINSRIRLTFASILDYYSARPFNFELFTDDGSHFAGVLQTDPQPPILPKSGDACYRNPVDELDSGFVQQVIIKPNSVSGTSFIPKKNYYLMMRSRPDGKSTDTPVGIASYYGSTLLDQSIKFKTGDSVLGLTSRSRLEVSSFGPGILLNGKPNSSLAEIIDARSVTMNPKASVYITFSEPFRHISFDAARDVNVDFGPIAINSSYQFPGVAIGVVSSAKQLTELISNVPDAVLNPSGWQTFIKNNLRTLDGTIRSENRKTLIFTPSVPYPDTSAQTIVVLLQGFVTRANRFPQLHSVIAGGFFHSSGVNLGEGFQDVKTLILGAGK
ncbi:MAG: hypothetical protein J0L93_01645 [Deltaproteobacteria bacterium]|nr:hypothetical protein [Deltaproteobacteria bacterium]